MGVALSPDSEYHPPGAQPIPEPEKEKAVKALWRRARRPFLLTSVATLLVLVPVLAPGGAAGALVRGSGPKISSTVPVFGPETIVDPQRVAGEPSIAVDTEQGTIYVAAPFGFSTSASFVWRSTDRG